MPAKILIVLLLSLFGLAPWCLADDYAQLKNDFAPVSGHILMPVGEEYLIDLDAAANLNEGDIVTLMTAGEKVIHPVSKEIIGTLDVPRLFLRVTRIKSGYSYVQPVNDGYTPQKGDKIVRFDSVPARLAPASAADQQAAQALRTALPQFDWLPADAAQPPLLSFVLENGILTVNDPNDLMLYQYDLNGEEPLVLHKPEIPVANVDYQDPESGFLNELLKGAINKISPDSLDAIDPKSGAIRPGAMIKGGAWFSPTIKGRPSGLAAADLDGDGLQEVAIALRDRLLIARIQEGNYRQVAEVDIPGGLQLLTLDSLDLDRNGQPELYLTAASGNLLRSFAVEYRSGAYTLFAEGIHWYLRAVTLPGRGPLLLGQERGTGTISFKGPVFRITRDGDRLTRSESLTLPDGVQLFSFVPFTGQDNRELYASLDDADRLVISTPDGLGIWQSQEAFGGSEILIAPDRNREDATDEPTYITPRLQLGKNNSIILVQNYGPRFLTQTRLFDSSRLVALKWNGSGLEESWSTPNLKGYTPDFTLGDIDNDGSDEAAILVQFERGGMFKDAKTGIVTYDQNK